MDKVYTRFQTKPAKKPDPMGRRMPSLYKGVPRRVADRMWKLMHTPVADRDLQISEWGEGSGRRLSRLRDKGSPVVSKQIFFGPSGLILV